MRDRMVLTMLLACVVLITPVATDAGGMRGAPPGLSIRGPVGKGQANASTAAVAGAALILGGTMSGIRRGLAR